MHITIDNRQYEARAGDTILDVARREGIDIPTLCYEPHLSIAGACRMCLVTLEPDNRLVTACTTPVVEDMRVLTRNPETIEARRMMLDLLLSEHPLDCLVCEANGNCALQDLAYEYGISESSFGCPTGRHFELKCENPFIEVDPDKCIRCGKCIRVDHEVQAAFAIDFVNRGAITTVATPFEQDLAAETSTCVFCGQCVEICPTGALTYSPSKGRGRIYDFESTETICPYCGVGCRIILRTRDNQVIQVGTAPAEGCANPRGESCVKGRFGYEYVNHPDRLTTPLIRKDGELQPASWDEALTYTAQRLDEVRRQWGADAVAGLSSAKCTNEENYLMQKFMRAVIGTNNVDHCARLCHASTVAGLAQAFGSGAMTNSIGEIGKSDMIFVIGSNPTENHPVIGSRIKSAVLEGVGLIVADPRDIELSEIADVHLQQRPGSDVALVNAMMNVIIEENLADENFIAQRTENFEAAAAVIRECTPERASEITGVPAEDIVRAARLYASADRGSIYFAMGITQHHTGTDNVLSLANLAMLSGNVGREGTGVNPLRGQNNVQGACDMGALPNVLPGYQAVGDDELRRRFEEKWGTALPEDPGLTVVEMMQAAGDQIRAMYIMGENPMVSDPDQKHVEEALEKLDFLLVQDIFLTETAQYADVVLPAVSFAEKEGTFTNTERRIQRVRSAVSPPDSARQDWQIICELAEKMGYDMSNSHPAEVMREIASLTPIYGGISYDRIEDRGLQWPCPHADHPGTPYLHRDQFSRGLGRFHPVEYIPPAETPDAEYDFVLMTGRMLYHFHTGTMTRRSQAIDRHEPDGYVEMNLDDCERLGISEGDRVRITSRRGSVQTFVRAGRRVLPGHLFMPFHYAESAANRLTGTALDPVAKIPELKVSAVKVERAS